MAQNTRTVPAGTPTNVTQNHTKGGIGESILRPDGTLKVTGEFAYSSDMWHEDMLWGQTLRSTVAHAEPRTPTNGYSGCSLNAWFATPAAPKIIQ